MSLLMDALKKAEQEKREAARRLEESGVQETTDHGGGARTEESTPASDDADPTLHRPLELSLEPVSGEFTTALPTPADGSAGQGESPTIQVPDSQLLSMELNTSQPMEQRAAPQTPSGLESELVTDDGFDGDMTFQGFDSEPPGQPAVPGMFEETVAGDMTGAAEVKSYDETLPGVSAVQLARDIGTRDQPTPVAAETVFVAGSGKESPSGVIKWALAGLTLVMLSAAGAWYYLAVTPVARNIPDPKVARGIESVPALRIDLPAATGGTEIAGAVPVPDAVMGAEAAPPQALPTEETLAGTATPVSPPPQAPESPAPVQAPEAPAPDAAAPDAGPATETPMPMTAVAVAPSLVQVKRSDEPSRGERMVRDAYGLYQSGDLGGARTLYLAALQEDGDNLDALLGIGAIALREGDAATAVEAHGHVLRLDPENPTALAALIGINKASDLGAAETAVNLLIQQSPEQPFLYFTLGNVYATQGRWPEAQQAFFDAYRLGPDNPDYALNLAVSLDRMGQRQSALDYYSTALRLAETQPSGFDPAAVLSRIQALEPGTAP